MPSKIFFVLMLTAALHAYGQKHYTDRYKNNAIRSEGLLNEGVKEGEWKYYYPSGKLMGKEMFKQGSLDGRVEYYYPNGQLQGIEQWKKGVLQDSAQYYYDNGRVEKKGIYRDNQYSENVASLSHKRKTGKNYPLQRWIANMGLFLYLMKTDLYCRREIMKTGLSTGIGNFIMKREN
jgi:hypothetical protein